MTQKPIEMILMSKLASSLAMPVFLVDLAGTLVFYNEPAEEILGLRFDETGEMPASEWGTRWEPSAADGSSLAPDALPLMVAMSKRRPARDTFWIRRVAKGTGGERDVCNEAAELQVSITARSQHHDVVLGDRTTRQIRPLKSPSEQMPKKLQT